MADSRRHKNTNWLIPDPANTYEQAQLAVLMDIRDELQRLCRIFECPNFQRVPSDLQQVRRNTTKRRRKQR